MFVNFNKKSAFVLSCLIVSTVCNAQTGAPQLSCPSLDILHEYGNSIEVGQIDLDGSYTAYSLPIINLENKTVWMLFVNNISAKSDEEAIGIGKNIVQNSSIQSNMYPYRFVGAAAYICGYGDNVFLFGGKVEALSSILKKIRTH